MKKKKKINLIWLLPTIALLVGFYLAYDRYSQYGAIIQITFPNAEGLEVGKTKIRYKNLDIGTVRDVRLSPALDSVIVEAQMDKNADNLLRKDSEFWIVKPQISTRGVMGLSTILSGSYIAVSIGKSEEYSRSFKALEDIPLVEKGERGLRLQLTTERLAGLNVGSPVYYQGMTVGQVEKIAFSEDFRHIVISAFIKAPYDKLVNKNSRFWNVSGFRATLGSQGAKFEMESLESLMMGGITFASDGGNANAVVSAKENAGPEDKSPASDGKAAPMTFTLHKNEVESRGKGQLRKESYLVYFPDSVRGLKVGAPVNFKGFDIGEVREINLIYDEKTRDAKVPVLVEIEPERINSTGGNSQLIANLVRSGLVASLETGNLFTGEKYVKLEMGKKPQTLKKDGDSNYDVLPSQPTELGRLTEDVSAIVANVKRLPLNQIAKNVEDLTRDLKGISGDLRGQLNGTLKNIDGLVKDLDRLARDSRENIGKTSDQLNQNLRQLDKVLKGLGPESSLYFTLEKTMNSLEKTSTQLDKLLKKLNGKPNSLIFGD